MHARSGSEVRTWNVAGDAGDQLLRGGRCGDQANVCWVGGKPVGRMSGVRRKRKEYQLGLGWEGEAYLRLAGRCGDCIGTHMQGADAFDVCRGGWADDELLSRPIESMWPRKRKMRSACRSTTQSKDGSRRGREIIHGMVTWRIKMAYEVGDLRLSV